MHGGRKFDPGSRFSKKFRIIFFHANFGIALKFWKVLENFGNFSRHPIAQANSLRNHVPARKFPKSLRFSPGFHHWREETGQRAYAGFRIVCARSRDSIRSALGRILKSWFSATPYFLGYIHTGYIHTGYIHTHTYTHTHTHRTAIQGMAMPNCVGAGSPPHEHNRPNEHYTSLLH